MKVVINALAVRSRHHGVGRYVTNLVSALAGLAAGNEYVILAHSDCRPLFDGLPGVEVQCIDLAPTLRVLWEHTVLPWVLWRLGSDLFFGPVHTVPLIKTTKQVVAILDMSWFRASAHHTRLKRWYFRSAIPISIKRADAVIAISEATKRDVLDIVDVREEDVFTTPLGFDQSNERSNLEEVTGARYRYGLSQAPYIMNIGVFEPRKNQEGLIRAFARLAWETRSFNHDLVLAGNVGYGWWKSETWRLAEKLGVSSRVKILDSLPDEELRHLLTGADVFVYPSFYEGFGLPILEAMACGVPVVTSRVSSMPEVGGDAARYVSPGDDEELATVLAEILHDEDVRRDMRESGLGRAAGFTWEECARRTLDAFAAAVSR